MNRRERGYQVVVWISIVAAVLTGAFLTYRIVIATGFVDADIVEAAVLRDGVAQHGVQFLASWSYTADNWVFSVLPVYSLIYALVGESPAVLVVSGWVVFLLCASLAAYLTWRLTDRLMTGAAVFAFLLCPNYWVIGPAGLLGQPMSHNTSLAWCLVAWLLILRSLRLQRLGHMLGASGIGLLLALSDPWALPSLLLPAFLSSMALAACRPHERTFFLRTSGLWLVATILARTRLLHALSFLPNYTLQRPDLHTLGENLGWTWRSLGLAFSVMPTGELTGGVALYLGFLSLLFVTGIACVRLLMSWRALTTAQLWMVLCLIFSLAGTVAGTAIGPTPPGFTALHFLINFYFLVPVVGSISACWLPSKWFSRTAIACGTLVAVTGVINASKMLRIVEQGDKSLVRAVKPLSDFLQQEHLTYGYGTYWGAQANAVTWYSRGRVVVRPIRFDPASGRVAGQHEQASRLWITPEDIPKNQSTFFVIFGKDGEVCPDPAVCEAGTIAQWGPPDRRLTLVGLRGRLTILVWSRRLYSPGTLAISE